MRTDFSSLDHLNRRFWSWAHSRRKAALFVAMTQMALVQPGDLSRIPLIGGLAIPKSEAAITFVRDIGTHALKDSHTTLTVVITGTGVAVGNTIIVSSAVDDFGGALPVCSDSKGNTYSTDVDTVASTVRLTISSTRVTTALSVGDTITVTHTSANASAASAAEYSGLASSGALDRVKMGAGSSAGPSSGTAATTTVADELLLGAVAAEGPVEDGFTVGAGYSPLARNGTTGSAAGSNMTINPEYRIVSATGNYAADGTLGASRSWVAAIATYKASTLSVSVSNSSFAFGTEPGNTWLAPQTAVVTNNGDVAENFAAKISQLTAGANTWALSTTANGVDIIRAQWSTTSSTGPWTDISAYDADFTIATNVAVSGTVNFWFRIQTPTATASYSQYSSTLTVTAAAY